MITVFVVGFDIKLYMLDRAVFNDEAFHVMMYVFWLVVCISWFCGRIELGIGGECEYSVMGSLCFRDSISSFSGRNGNSFVNS
jgi:hypothetical protein